jgi:hypothetical protein
MLETTRPPRTCVALMEANAGMPEDEYLLGCGTEFSAIDRPTQMHFSAAADFLGVVSGQVTPARFALQPTARLFAHQSNLR